MPIDVREATPPEYEEAGRVTALAYSEFVRPGEREWELYLERLADVGARARNALVLIAVDADRIVGSATLELGRRIEDDDPPLAPDESHIRMLGVHPEERGRGVARALMSACEARARAAGKRRMTLHTTQRMRAAQAMYPALGYRRQPDRVLEGGFVLLTFSKSLTAAARPPSTRDAAQPGWPG
jgi:ribosomal protein S18 acetylase RimI-like enzyme